MLKSLLLITIFSIGVKTQNDKYMPAGYWVIESTRISRVIRMSLKNQEGLKNSTPEEKAKYTIENFHNKGSIVQYFSGNTVDTDVTSKYNNIIDNNQALAKVGSITINSRAKESVEFLSGQMTIKGPAYAEWKNGATLGTVEPSLINKADQGSTELINFNTQWVTKTDWKQISYVVWSIVKAFMNIIMIYITLGRPFMENFKKLRAIWIGQSVMFYQLVTYSGLTVGVFGGLIDDIQEGVIKASRRLFYFIPTNPGFSEDRGFVIYKFYQNELIPFILEEAFIESVLVIGITGLYILGRFCFSKKTLTIVREMKGCIYMFCMLPLSVHGFHTAIVHTLLQDFDNFYVILNMAVVIVIMVIYVVQIIFMVETVRQINYLHSRGIYQEGKVELEQGSDMAFDTYVSMKTNVRLRILEFLAYEYIFLIWAVGYLAASATATIVFITYLFLIYSTWQKYSTFELGTEERKYQHRVLMMSFIHTILLTIQHFIFLIFWWWKNISINMVQFLTYLYLLFFFADIILIIGQTISRIVRLDVHSAWDDGTGMQKSLSMRPVNTGRSISNRGTVNYGEREPVYRPGAQNNNGNYDSDRNGWNDDRGSENRPINNRETRTNLML